MFTSVAFILQLMTSFYFGMLLVLERSRLPRPSLTPRLALAKGEPNNHNSPKFVMLLLNCSIDLVLPNSMKSVTPSCAFAVSINSAMKSASLGFVPSGDDLVAKLANFFSQESFNSRLKAEGDESSTNLYISNLP